MKFLVVPALAVLFAVNVRAAPTETLKCGNPEAMHHGAVWLDLDSSFHRPGSGFKVAVDGRILYQFSSVGHLICDGFIERNEFDIDCVGIYSGLREPTVVKVRTEGGKIVAYWKTSRLYKGKDMKSECQVGPLE